MSSEYVFSIDLEADADYKKKKSIRFGSCY